ncbi:ribosomal-processing cysteine protease Prp [Metabacillus arenae]|uniref:Ribosomal processing cysteine protease Prp n=1 Tax=Metabacillus arenae TaxID=2771434 RepID=A0A926NIL0_9BACI|nr:ribosomal-processing cysteine protease Prp [Metabacillus arenae]MBD1381208.1 ribosomal-processing cysteine protease Prp [Metabacillus arenae]
MIKATFFRSVDGSIETFHLTGHADFAEHGKDLVCAGASAVVFGSINAILALTKIEPKKLDLGPDGGYLNFELPDHLDGKVQNKVQILLEGMLVSLQTIEADYGEHIQVIQNHL